MAERVYLETTILSYLTAWESSDVVRAAHQELTKRFWARRHEFELYVSDPVLEEMSRGDPEAASARLGASEGIPVLPVPQSAEDLAAELLLGAAMPEKAAVDALHVGISAVHGMDVLLTWNCRHIANAIMRPRIEEICRRCGFEPPVICTPWEILGEEAE